MRGESMSRKIPLHNLFQFRSTDDPDFTTLYLDQSLILEIRKNPDDGLGRGANHLGEVLPRNGQ